MTTVMTISCDECGVALQIPVSLRDDQTMLHQPALADTMLRMFTCNCPEEDDE